MNAFRRLNRQKYNILLSFILNGYQYYFFLQSKWNEIGCRILFSRLFLGLAGLHCSRPPQLHLLKEKKRKSNFSSFKSSFIFRSFVLRSLQDISTSEILTHKSNRHHQFCCSYIYIYADQYIYQQDKVNYAVSERELDYTALYWTVLGCTGLNWVVLGSAGL